MSGVALGIAVMILSVAIVTGFQTEVRNLVVGFGSHYQVVPNTDNYSKDSERLEIQQDFYPTITQTEGIRHVQVFATKAGILETTENIQGVVIKGIAEDFDWGFFRNRLVKGDTLSIETGKRQSGMLISSYLSRRLELDTGDRVTLYFISGKEDISPRKFKIQGIYDTGLQEFDQKYVFVDIGHIQKLSGWGLEAQLLVDSCKNGQVELEALAFGGEKPYEFEWPGYDLEGPGPHSFCVEDASTVKVVARDAAQTLPDTAFIAMQNGGELCSCEGFSKNVSTTGGSWKYYAGGFEILLNDFQDLDRMDEEIMYQIPFFLKTVSIVDQSPEIFSWLEVLDVNVIIIIVLMILVSVINMASALLILILERTGMIGMLKAFGFTNWGVVRVFLYQAAWIIGRGMIIGNIIALCLGYLQLKYQFFKLDADQYYLSHVPVQFNWLDVLFLNVGTLILSILFLIVPALYVTKISPARAIRFD